MTRLLYMVRGVKGTVTRESCLMSSINPLVNHMHERTNALRFTKLLGW